MNRGIHGAVFAASLFVAGLAFAQTAAPPAAPAADQAAPAKNEVTPQQQIADLIKQLAADDFATRDAASNELLKRGQDALPALKEALKSDDPSIQSYAEYLVPRIEGGDGRKGNGFRRTPPQQLGIAPGRGMAADVFVTRNARIAINVTGNNNGRTTNIVDGDRKVTIEEGANGIRMSVTDNDNGKAVQKDYQAKSIEELRKEHPEAADIYDKYNGRGRALRLGGPNAGARVFRLAPPTIDDNGLNGVQRQLDDVQKLQDRALDQQRQAELRVRDLLDKQNPNLRDQQLEAVHRRLQAETEMLERRLAEVEAMHQQLLEQTKAAQKRLAELEKQQQERQQDKPQRAR